MEDFHKLGARILMEAAKETTGYKLFLDMAGTEEKE